MPRTSSFSSSSKSHSTPAHVPVSTKPFAPTSFTYSGPVMPRPSAPTLGQSMKEGFGLGLGVSVARNLVDSWFAKPPQTPTTNTPAAPAPAPSGTSVTTEFQKREYVQCMQTINDHEHCKKLIETSS